MWPFSASNTAIVTEKRADRARLLSEVSKDASESQQDFLRATASQIVERIAAGEWTASEVLEAYITRAAFAHEKTNCLTEVMLEPARQRAKELDQEFASTKKLRGPLHGVPISIKDQFNIVGYDSTVGFSQWSKNPATKNADLVKQLLDAGAVLYVKTNIPQTMFAFECSNPLWGRTTNPYNSEYTSGGSSGGEGALLAMDGAAAGIGTDIGGSLRIPAAYCGIYSLKPGSGRVSYIGAKGPVGGFDGVVTVAGPMARSVKDVELVARATFGGPSTANAIAPIPYRDVTLPPKLCFGYYTSDNYIKASPACKRAVLETVDVLRKAGHECVEFELPEANVSMNLFVGLTSCDGYQTMLSHLGPDPKENALFLSTIGPKVPGPLRNFAAWTIETFFGDKIFADTMRCSRKKPVADYWDLSAQKGEFVKRFYEHVWDKYNFDGIIAPVQALPQLPHGGCDNFSMMANATIYYNMLDLPVGCLPVTRVDPVKDKVTEEWLKEAGHGSSILESGIYHSKKPLYDPEAANGMPVNIQIAGKKWEEEKVVAMMGVLDEALGANRGFGPGAWDNYMKTKTT
ncbi:amidase [Panaeolus papilionaceus]|nr:amidase [Panaeolus papilionaceus]